MIKSTTTQAIRKTRRIIIAEFFAKGKQSFRALGKQINCRKRTVHRHLKKTASLRDQHPETVLWETKAGEAWLRLMIFAVLYKFGIQHTVGADALSDFFKMIRINDHIGVSPGALRTQLNQMEDLMIGFQGNCERSIPNEKRKVVLAADETYFGELLILVLMDLSSGYLLLETIQNDRSFDTWLAQANPRLEALGIKVGHAITDRAKALIKLAVDGFDCAPGADVFHEQYGISRWLGPVLGRHQAKADKRCEATQKAVNKASDIDRKELEIQPANALSERHEINKAQQTYHTNLLGITDDLHPFALDDNRSNTGEAVALKLENRAVAFEVIAAQQGILDKNNALQKFRNQIVALSSHVSFWWLWVGEILMGLSVDEPTRQWLTGTLLPVVYWHYHRYKTKNPVQRKRYQEAWQRAVKDFETDSFYLSLPESELQHWVEWAEWMVRQFHRSSSAVEGRNGRLSQMYHNGRGLKKKRLMALTVIHNYGQRRSDGSTAAERLFDTAFPDLFGWVVDNMGELPLPRKARQSALRNPLKLVSVPA